MSDEERIEQLELEVKVLRDNNKGLKDKIDEQSKEIEELKEKTKKCEYYEMVADELSKEIEELKKYKEGYKLLNYGLDNYISKDKIKQKIEELKKIIEFEKPTYEEELKYAIEVLQSLLKED